MIQLDTYVQILILIGVWVNVTLGIIALRDRRRKK